MATGLYARFTHYVHVEEDLPAVRVTLPVSRVTLG